VDTTQIVDYILNWAKMRQRKELITKTKTTEKDVVGVAKLYDANWAGTF
jgi:hypothetical protein